MLDKVIKSRKSVKRFSSRKPDWRIILECLDSVRFAPMAGNNFSLRFLVIDDAEKIHRIAEFSEQSFIEQAHYVVVFCSEPGKTLNLYGKRGEKYLNQQAGAGIQNFLLKIAENKLSTCWVGHFNDTRMKHLLGIPDDVEIEAVFPVGYEYKKTPFKKKIDFERLVYFNKYKQKFINPPKRSKA